MLDGTSYRILQLRNGTTIYTRDDYVLPETGEHSRTMVIGLDDQDYHFLDNEVVFTVLSTFESRRKLNELKHMLMKEDADFKHVRLMELQEFMAKQQSQGQAQSAADALMHGARPVVLS